jgi:hypothetical protein
MQGLVYQVACCYMSALQWTRESLHDQLWGGVPMRQWKELHGTPGSQVRSNMHMRHATDRTRTRGRPGSDPFNASIGVVTLPMVQSIIAAVVELGRSLPSTKVSLMGAPPAGSSFPYFQHA